MKDALKGVGAPARKRRGVFLNPRSHYNHERPAGPFRFSQATYRICLNSRISDFDERKRDHSWRTISSRAEAKPAAHGRQRHVRVRRCAPLTVRTWDRSLGGPSHLPNSFSLVFFAGRPKGNARQLDSSG